MSVHGKDCRHQHRRFAAGGNGYDQRDPRDAEIERLRQRVRELEDNQYARYESNESEKTESVVWDDYEDDDFHNNFARRPR